MLNNNVSQGQISIYNLIGTRLSAALMEEFRQGNIGISAAYEAAKHDDEMQSKIEYALMAAGGITEEDIRRMVSNAPIEGQVDSFDSGRYEESENVTESVTLGEKENVTESVTLEEKENVTESVTLGEKENVTESVTLGEKENVTESVTSGESKNVTESVTSEEKESVTESVTFEKSADYDMDFVDGLIDQYSKELNTYKVNKLSKLARRTGAILDALELLRKVM